MKTSANKDAKYKQRIREELVKATHEYIYSSAKDRIAHGVYLCNQWQLFDEFDPFEICNYFIEQKYNDLIKSFIGTQSSMEYDRRVAFQRSLLQSQKKL